MDPHSSRNEKSRSANVVLGIALLLGYQLFGEIVVQMLGLPFPGPVVGMLALFLTLIVRGGWEGSFEATSLGLLRHLSLLFVPAGVGVMVHIQRIGGEWVAIVVALVVSTLLSLGATALLMQVFSRRRSPVGRGNQNGS